MGFLSPKPSPPPTPDYTGAAVAQGAANKEAALATAFLSNPNISSPYGTRSVTYAPGPEKETYVPNISDTLAPGQQQIFDQEQALSQKLGELGNSAASYAGGTLSKPLDFAGAPAAGRFTAASGVPALPAAFHGGLDLPLNPTAYQGATGVPSAPTAYQGAGNLPNMPGNYDAVRGQVIDAMMSRVNTDMARKRNSTNSDLVARGIMPQNEAYGREMDTIGRQENDARQQALVAGGDAAAQAFGVDLTRRQQGYNEAVNDAQLRFGQGMDLNQNAYQQQANDAQLRFGQAKELNDKSYDQQIRERDQRFGQQLALSQAGYTQATDQQKTQFRQQQEARQQAITEALAQRQVPLNEISAFRTGSQVQPLQFQNYTGADVAPPPLFNAAQAQYGASADAYNQQAAQRNNTMSGLFGLGSSYLLGR